MDFYFYFIPKMLIYSLFYSIVIVLLICVFVKLKKTTAVKFILISNFIFAIFFVSLFFTNHHPGIGAHLKIPLDNENLITQSFQTSTSLIVNNQIYPINDFLIDDELIYAKLSNSDSLIVWDSRKDQIEKIDLVNFNVNDSKIQIKELKPFNENFNSHWNFFYRYLLP